MTVVDRLAATLDGGAAPLERVAAVVREAFGVDRVSLARIDTAAGTFEITAEAGSALLPPGTALPLETCSYFAGAREGRAFGDGDFDASSTFRLPLDGVILAAGYHSGCSVPIRRDGLPVAALSLSSSQQRRDMTALADELGALARVLAPGLDARSDAVARGVLVCCADPLVGRGIARLVELEDGVGAVVAATLADAVAAAEQAGPELVVCDDWLDGVRVDDVARALRAAGVTAPLVVVSSRDTSEGVRASLRAGAAARVSRRDAVTALPPALTAARRGQQLEPSTPLDDGPRLTARELELLRRLDEGLRFKQVARLLGISEATAKTHARNVFRKLGAASRAEAVHRGRERGLLA